MKNGSRLVLLEMGLDCVAMTLVARVGHILDIRVCRPGGLQVLPQAFVGGS